MVTKEWLRTCLMEHYIDRQRRARKAFNAYDRGALSIAARRLAEAHAAAARAYGDVIDELDEEKRKAEQKEG